MRGGNARRREAGLGDLTSHERALTVLDPVARGRMARTKYGFAPLFMRSACVSRFAIPIRRVRERGRIDHQVVIRSAGPGLDRVAKPTLFGPEKLDPSGERWQVFAPTTDAPPGALLHREGMICRRRGAGSSRPGVPADNREEALAAARTRFGPCKTRPCADRAASTRERRPA